MEPFFSVLLSALFLGEKATAPVLLTLLPIVGGVAAASVSEVPTSPDHTPTRITLPVLAGVPLFLAQG